jgi:hypothetical protein
MASAKTAPEQASEMATISPTKSTASWKALSFVIEELLLSLISQT